MNSKLLLLICILAYYFLTNYVRKRINLAHYISEERRALHKRLIWWIPFLGPLMLSTFWRKKKEKLKVNTKYNREDDKSDFYESGIAIKGDIFP